MTNHSTFKEGDDVIYTTKEGYWEWTIRLIANVTKVNDTRVKIAIMTKSGAVVNRWVSASSLQPLPTTQQLMNELMVNG